MPDLQPRFIQYDHENSRRARNIDPDTWEQFRHTICDLHRRGLSKHDVLNILLTSDEVSHTDFRPSIHQLVGRMKAWGLRADDRQMQDSSTSSASHSTESLAQSDSLPSVGDQRIDLPVTPQSYDMQCSPLEPQPTFDEPGTDDFTLQSHWLSDISPSSSPPSRRDDGASYFPASTPGDAALTDSESIHAYNTEDYHQAKVCSTEPKAPARDHLCEIESSMSSLSVKTRTSCNFERVTKMPSVLGLSICRQVGTQNVVVARRGLDFAQARASYYQPGRVFKHLFYRQRPGEFTDWPRKLEQKIELQTFQLAVVNAFETSCIAVPIYRCSSTKVQSFSRQRMQQLAPVHLRNENPTIHALQTPESLKSIGLSVCHSTRLGQADRIDFGWPIRFSYDGFVSDLGAVTSSSMKRFNCYSQSVMRPGRGDGIEPVDCCQASRSLLPLTTATVDLILSAMAERGSWPDLVEQL